MKDFIAGFKSGFKQFGHNISLIVNSVLLSFVYFVGVGLTSIISKIMKKHFLDLKRKKSYWLDWNLSKKDMEEYYRQF